MSLRSAVKSALKKTGLEVHRAPGQVMLRRVGHRTPVTKLASSGLRLNLGCGPKPLPRFVNVDLVARDGVDLVASIDKLPLPDGCAAHVRLDAVYEHLYRWQRPEALAEWRRVLEPSGRLEINWIPDFDAFVRLYLDGSPGCVSERFDLFEVYRQTHGAPTRMNGEAQLHKDLFTRESVAAELMDAGYTIESIESVKFDLEPVAVSLNVLARR